MENATEALNPLQLAAEIRKAVDIRHCIAWVGAGLSRPVYDDWPLAVTKLCKACGVKDVDESLPGTKSDQLINKAEECKKANEETYEATLAEIYGREEVTTRRAYPWLVKAPFKAYVTTNFDPLLSEAAAVADHTHLFCYPLLECPDLERYLKPIFYIHGHARRNGAPSGKNLVLAQSEFDKAYGDCGVVALFVQNLLHSYPIVFIGSSLSEPATYEQIQRVHSMHALIMESRPDYVPRPRLALLPTIIREDKSSGPQGKKERDTGSEQTEVNRFSELETKVLRYHAADPNQHGEIEEVLRHLCDQPEVASVISGEEGPK